MVFCTHIVEGALIDYFLRQKCMIKKESDFKEEQKKRMINKNLILKQRNLMVKIYTVSLYGTVFSTTGVGT